MPSSDIPNRSPEPGGIPGRPQLEPVEAAAISERLYGVRGNARPLPSDRDANFRIDVDGQPRFVLKVMNRDTDPALPACQVDAMRLAAAAGLPVPDPVSPGDMQNAPQEADSGGGAGVPLAARLQNGSEHAIWMVRWMDGTPLGNAEPVDRQIGTDLGRLLGRLDTALDGFNPPAAHRTLDWDVARAADTVRRTIDAIPGRARREQVRYHLARCEHEIDRLGPDARRAVIHGDANDFNVLVGPPRSTGRSVTGLLDFGDIHHSFLAAEPAIGAAYLMMRDPDPLGMLAAVAAGYHASNPLRSVELELLYPLVCARLCISVCMSARQRAMEPANEYLSVSEAGAWRVLDQLRDVHPRLAAARIRTACGLEPVPLAARLREALRTQTSFAPVLQPDPAVAAIRVFDFSVGSAEFDVEDLTVPGKAHDQIFESMAAADAAVGIGRYGEARIAYTGAQFRTPGGGTRTRHLGVDLFQPAGSTVYCPLDGVVHSMSHDPSPGDYGPCVIVEHEIGARDGRISFFTLFGHLTTASLTQLNAGDRLAAGDPIGEIGDAHENGGWVPHLHLQIVTDLLGMRGTFPGVAAPDEFEAWTGFSPDANLILRIPGLEACDPVGERDRISDLRAQHAGPSLSLHYDRPLHIVRGRMQYLFDSEGRRYLDCVNNVAHVGHANPRVVEAEHRQAAVLNTNTRYLHANLVEYARRLASTLPDGLEVCWFVNSGSEANDLAVRMARTATGRRDMIVLDGAYHGNLSTLIDLSPYKFDGPGGHGRPAGTHIVPMPDPYRGAHRGKDAGQQYASYVEKTCWDTEARGGVAAMIAESVPGCGGQIVPPAGYLAAAADHVRAHGGLFIIDEVQVGMGRAGSAFWGFEALEGDGRLSPDIVVIGKPIGNGHPLAAVVTTRAVAEAFDNGMEYFNTFGGNPVSCAVGLAVLDEIEEADLQKHALRVGGRLKDGLSDLMSSHDVIGDVRGVGLFLGVELVRDRVTLEPATEEARYVVNRLARKGILTSTDGPFGNVIKIKPPLPFGERDADEFVSRLDTILHHDFVRGSTG